MSTSRSVATGVATATNAQIHLKVCLVGPATETDFTDVVLMEQLRKKLPAYAPIGILTLAAVLERFDTPLEIVDLNRLHRDYLASNDRDRVEFCEYAARAFIQMDCDIFGFSTICGSYPLTLRIAELVKRMHPRSRILLGGPQASVVDRETLEAFGYVDVIVRGEAEETLPQLLLHLQDHQSLHQLPGITYREGSEICRADNAPVIKDLDQIPLPAYHLYPDAGSHHLSLELGRGCPFACTFCSTNDFFRRTFRLKSPQHVLKQMDELNRAYGIDTFDLVHDMFTVDRKKVVAFCDMMIASGRNYRWSCSARTDCVDRELLSLMQEAGCRGIFFGIETGSARLQKIVKKNIDLVEAMDAIRCCDELQIKATASLITGFPQENSEDVRDTAGMFVDCLRLDYVEPQLHLLSPLAGTILHKSYASTLTFDSIISDMSYQGWEQNVAEKELIAAHPEIFPNFYGIPIPGIDRQYLSGLRNFLITGMERVHWLLVALHQADGHIVDVFDKFSAWRRSREPLATNSDRYFGGPTFLADFVAFARTEYGGADNADSSLVEAVLQFESALKENQPKAAADLRSELGSSRFASLAPSVQVFELNSNFASVIKQLRLRKPVARVTGEKSTIATRRSHNGRYEVIQLSALSAALLRICATEASLDEIRSRFETSCDMDPDGIPSAMVCEFGLQHLEQTGLIRVQ